MNHSDIEHMAQGFPPSHIGKDHEEVVIWLATQLLDVQQKLDALAAKPETTSQLKVELPELEKWRSVDQVRAQMAYRVLVEKALIADGFEVKS